MPLLSILIPVYNEEEFLEEVVQRVLSVELPGRLDREVIIVDDASTDGTAAIADALTAKYPDTIRVWHHPVNSGKGAAIVTALAHARGEFSLIQDADLEYDPVDYPRLLGPLLQGAADAVFGSRFLSGSDRRVLYFWHSVANRMLTTMSNVISDLNLTDMETCYKAFRTSLVQSIPLRSKRFGIEPELTIKLAKRQARIFEVPIGYHGRTYDEGKKIGLKDAFQAIGVMLKCWFSNDLYKDPGAEILDSFSVAPNFNRWMADSIRKHAGRKVFEIGAGMGNLSRQMIGGRDRYVATDIDVEHLARLRARLKHRANLETAICDVSHAADFTNYAEAMDTVICLNVIEHIEDDHNAMKNINSILKTGGTAIILVPHGPGIFGTLDVVLGHYRRYTNSQLQKLMEGANFEVREIIEFNRISRPAWFMNGKILKRKTITRSQLALFDSLVGLWRKIDSYIPWPPTSIIAIGVKKN